MYLHVCISDYNLMFYLKRSMCPNFWLVVSRSFSLHYSNVCFHVPHFHPAKFLPFYFPSHPLTLLCLWEQLCTSSSLLLPLNLFYNQLSSVSCCALLQLWCVKPHYPFYICLTISLCLSAAEPVKLPPSGSTSSLLRLLVLYSTLIFS